MTPVAGTEMGRGTGKSVGAADYFFFPSISPSASRRKA
jgi:hypothetical protein